MNMDGNLEEVILSEPVEGVRQNTVYKVKICLIGDGGTGKTTYINKVLNGEFISKYYATHGAVTRNVTFDIGGNSRIEYEVWDTAGQEKYAGLKDGYYVGAAGAFFFFDVNSRETMSNIPKHIRAFENACNANKPVIIVIGNKVDIRSIKPNDSSRMKAQVKSSNGEVLQISAKSGYNFAKPFEALTKALFKDPSIEIRANIDLTPLANNYDFLAGDSTQNLVDNVANFIPEDIDNAGH